MITKTVWKKALRPELVQTIEVPAGSEFLLAREQNNQPCVWFRCDPKAALEPRKIFMTGTNGLAPADGRYLGSCFIEEIEPKDDVVFVFHVFET